MEHACRCFEHPHEVEMRLAQIGGLRAEILREAVEQGELSRSSCTGNHPRLAGPLYAYFETNRALRDLLGEVGWVGANIGGSELTVSPDGEHAIVVAAGDENTGCSLLVPKTKSQKGPRMAEAVSANALQENFFAELGMQSVREVTIARRRQNPNSRTWVLLVSRSDEVLSIELSLPVLVGGDRRPAHWSERIILPSISLNDDPAGMPDFGPIIDVEVTRRSA